MEENEKENEKQKSFRVVDRRHFTTEGEPLPDAQGADDAKAAEATQGGTEKSAPPQTPEPSRTAASPAQTSPAAGQTTGGEPPKKSLKERIFGRKKVDEQAEEGAGAGEFDDPEGPLPEIEFTSFIFSLVTQALIHLGEAPDPITKKRERILPLAKQTIDLLSLLSQKTRGNLTPDESRLLDSALYDLRLRYVQLSREK